MFLPDSIVPAGRCAKVQAQAPFPPLQCWSFFALFFAPRAYGEGGDGAVFLDDKLVSLVCVYVCDHFFFF